MTNKIRETLNLPSIEEMLGQQVIGEPVQGPEEVPAPPPKEPVTENKVAETVGRLNDLTARMALLEGTEHTESMDELYREILQHARDLMQYGYNIDHPRARGIFEIAASMYGHAMSAANSKRDAQLRAMKMSLDRKKLELEEKRTNHVIGQQAAVMEGDNTIVVEDRNELIRRLRSQMQEGS